MKAEVLFELPLDSEAAEEMVALARKNGTARLSVVLERATGEGKRNPTRANLAYALGQDVVALSQAMLTLDGAGKFIETKLVDE